jgi:hypothetical protein
VAGVERGEHVGVAPLRLQQEGRTHRFQESAEVKVRA